MFARNNAFRILATPISSVLVSLIRNGAEHRMWANAHGGLCILYRDSAGNLTAVTEDWTQAHSTRVYRACDTGSESMKARTVGAFYGELCSCNEVTCGARHEAWRLSA